MRIRSALALLVLTLAGCTTPSDDPTVDEGPAGTASEDPDPWQSGRVWSGLPTGISGSNSSLGFPVGHPGSSLNATFTKGWEGGAAAPKDLASAMIRVRGPDGGVLAELMLAYGGSDHGNIRLHGLRPGNHALEFTFYGGSVVDSVGHYIDYRYHVGLPEGI